MHSTLREGGAVSVYRNIVYALLARRFVAGEDMQDALRRACELEEKGFGTIINILGEHVEDDKAALRFTQDYRALAQALAPVQHKARIALKLTQIGLCVSEDTALENLLEILAECRRVGVVAEIDREGPEFHDATRRIITGIPPEFRSRVRICVQTNYEHGYDEIFELVRDGFSVRVCKGAYQGDTANTDVLRERILRVASEFYNRPAPRFLASLRVAGNKSAPNAYDGLPNSDPVPTIAYATHDLFLLERIPPIYTHHQDFELQLLMGIENGYAWQLMQQGYAVRLYVPYGPGWWPYGRRRLTSILKIYWRNARYRLFHR